MKTHPDASRIAAAQTGDSDAMRELLDDYAPALAAATAARVKAGHDREDAEQDTTLAFIEAVHAHDLSKSPTLAGYIARALRVGIARPTALAIPPTTLSRYRAIMRAVDFDVNAALRQVDAGDTKMTRSTFLAVHDAIFAEPIERERYDDDGEPVDISCLGRLAVPDALDARVDAASAALNLLDPLCRNVIRLRTGLDELHDDSGRRVQVSKVSWARIADALGVDRREARAAYDVGTAQLRATLS